MFSGRKHSEETKQKMRLARSCRITKDETREKLRIYRLAHPCSKETLEKIRKANTGKKRTQEFKDNQHDIKLGDKNPFWKGDNVGNYALHAWLRRNLHKPELCEFCNMIPSYDLANITGIYKRDFSNWKYLCRSCHMKFDYDSGLRTRLRKPQCKIEQGVIRP